MTSTVQRPYTYNGRAYLNDSDIVSSRISSSRITGLTDPIGQTDAVSLGFLQTSFTTNSFTVVNITGTGWMEIPNMPLFGNRMITINNITSGAPNASWRVSKSQISAEASFTKLAFSPSDDGCVFEVVWMKDTALQIRKSNDNWDGDYEITISR